MAPRLKRTRAAWSSCKWSVTILRPPPNQNRPVSNNMFIQKVAQNLRSSSSNFTCSKWWHRGNEGVKRTNSSTQKKKNNAHNIITRDIKRVLLFFRGSRCKAGAVALFSVCTHYYVFQIKIIRPKFRIYLGKTVGLRFTHTILFSKSGPMSGRKNRRKKFPLIFRPFSSRQKILHDLSC